ncbi:hypothetical protein RvY_04006-2 [Ramazzottius varieornatus]|nr:hypothetical protein RvY_04006-2 [Ramazzottius varieornatus]
MEFFRFMTFTLRLALTEQTVSIFVIFIWKRREISELLLDMSRILTWMEKRYSLRLRRIRNVSALLAFIWIGFWLGVHVIGYITFQIQEDLSTLFGFTRQARFLSLVGAQVPAYVDDIVGGATLLINTHTELVAATFVYSIIALMITGFTHVLQDLQKVAILPSEKEQVIAVQKACRLYLRFRTLTAKFNKCFALLFAIFFSRDVWSFLVVYAVALRIDKLQGPEESQHMFEYRKKKDFDHGRHDIIVGSIGLGNAALKHLLCLYCHITVRDIVMVLEELEDKIESQDVQAEVTEMLSKIQSCSGAISAGGVHITTESAMAVLGMLASYAVIIYQTRDAALGDQEYAKKTDLPQLAEMIRGLMQNTSTSDIKF